MKDYFGAATRRGVTAGLLGLGAAGMGAAGMGAASSQAASDTAHPGRNAGADEQSDMFSFDGWAGPALPVWTYTPDTADTSLPLVIVMHG